MKTGKFNIFSSEYNPLKKAHLERLLAKGGFKNIRFFGDHKFNGFDIKKDEYLIVVCTKQR